MRAKDAVGRFGEQVAADHLASSGLTILERNWRCRAGEIDIVARDGPVIAIVEVKTRSSAAYGDPAEAVNAVKSARLRQLGVQWLIDRRESLLVEPWPQLRFDVVSVLRNGSGQPLVRHLKAAF